MVIFSECHRESMPVVLQFKTTNTVDEIADRKIYNGTLLCHAPS